MMAVAGRATMAGADPAGVRATSPRSASTRAPGSADAARGLPLQVTGAGSLFKVTATARTLRNYRDAATTDKRWESLLLAGAARTRASC